MESTFQEVRQRLGFETQRDWSEMAIQRTACGTFDAVLRSCALRPSAEGANATGRAASGAWYEKEHPTFSDALALVRKELWAQQEATFCGSAQQTETVKVPRKFMERLTDAVCYAA